MDTLQISKIVGAVLAAILLLVGANLLVNATLGDRGSTVDGKPIAGYTLEVDEDDDDEAATAKAPAKAEPAPTAAAPAAPAAETPSAEHAAAPAAATDAPAQTGAAAIVAMVSSYTPKNGKRPFKKCAGCHAAAEGAGNKAGPNLWGIVGRPKASVEGFAYSAALKRKGGDWTLEDLASFLKNPKKYVVGTKMFFKGFKKDKDVAKILAYLSSLK